MQVTTIGLDLTNADEPHQGRPRHGRTGEHRLIIGQAQALRSLR